MTNEQTTAQTQPTAPDKPYVDYDGGQHQAFIEKACSYYDTKAPTSGKRSVTHQTVTKPFSSLLSPKHGLLPWALMVSLSPFLYQSSQA
ncbi:hypothetical protein INR49_013952 [Caranx melampygus]|nr:hypothetical protein INR49_013952 [Caranx melampygus]